MTAYIEATLSRLFKNSRGRDAKSICSFPALADFKEPTITITSPDCGASPAILSKEYIAPNNKLPGLEWEAPHAIAGQVKEWIIIVEDVDAPVLSPVNHG